MVILGITRAVRGDKYRLRESLSFRTAVPFPLLFRLIKDQYELCGKRPEDTVC